jgi:hypothetical protein
VSATGSGATGTAVSATATGSGGAIKATNTGSGPAVHATSAGPAPAVQANSTSGRGGMFTTGTVAQIQLVPGTGASHPTGGKAGDLYVDKSARLWFCKVGGTTATWAQVV